MIQVLVIDPCLNTNKQENKQPKIRNVFLVGSMRMPSQRKKGSVRRILDFLSFRAKRGNFIYIYSHGGNASPFTVYIVYLNFAIQ